MRAALAHDRSVVAWGWFAVSGSHCLNPSQSLSRYDSTLMGVCQALVSPLSVVFFVAGLAPPTDSGGLIVVDVMSFGFG